MGEFLVMCANPDGRVMWTIARNSLMWRAQGKLLRRVFPSASGGLADFKLGFGGPAYQSRFTKPTLWDLYTHLPGRRGRWLDYVGGDSNEGAGLDDAMRAMFGYARKEVSLTLENDAKGIHIDSGWKTWTNALTWARHGDWTPIGYYDDPSNPAGSYPQPYKYWNCRPGRPDHGFPWCSPRVSHATYHNWWGNDGKPYRCWKAGAWDNNYLSEGACTGAGGTWQQDTNPPDNTNERSECYDLTNDDWLLGRTLTQCNAIGGEMRTVGGVECAYCHQLFYVQDVCSVRIGVAYLTYEVSGEDPLILAAATIQAPIMWRPGGKVAVRYLGRAFNS